MVLEYLFWHPPQGFSAVKQADQEPIISQPLS